MDAANFVHLPVVGFGSVGCRCFTNVVSSSNRMLVDGYTSGASVSGETWTGYLVGKRATAVSILANSYCIKTTLLMVERTPGV